MKAEEVGKKARESASLEMLWEKEPGRVEETESMQGWPWAREGEGYSRGMDAWASTGAGSEETG